MNDPLDGDAVGLECRDREIEGGRRTGAALVGHLDHDAPTAAVVDDDLEVVVPEALLESPPLGRAAEGSVAADHATGREQRI